MKNMILIALMLSLACCTSYSDSMPAFVTEKPGSSNPGGNENPGGEDPGGEDPGGPEEPGDPEEILLFYDDFEGSALDAAKWTETPWGEVAWNYFMGMKMEEFPVEDGNLKLQAIWDEDHSGGANCTPKGLPRTMGVQTKDKFSFTYGELQVRAKFSRTGAGSWPAIWLMPQTPVYDGWAACGEIDIMERYNTRTEVSHAVHWSNDRNVDTYKDKLVKETDADVELDLDEYNIYTVRKTPNRLEFKVNGVTTMVFAKDEVASISKWPFETDFYIILNQASATSRDYAGNWLPVSPQTEWITDTSYFPLEMAVDWVKVIAIDPEDY